MMYPVVKMVNGRPTDIMMFADDRSAHHWVRRNKGWVRIGTSPMKGDVYTYDRIQGQGFALTL